MRNVERIICGLTGNYSVKCFRRLQKITLLLMLELILLSILWGLPVVHRTDTETEDHLNK